MLDLCDGFDVRSAGRDSDLAIGILRAELLSLIDRDRVCRVALKNDRTCTVYDVKTVAASDTAVSYGIVLVDGVVVFVLALQVIAALRTGSAVSLIQTDVYRPCFAIVNSGERHGVNSIGTCINRDTVRRNICPICIAGP